MKTSEELQLRQLFNSVLDEREQKARALAQLKRGTEQSKLEKLWFQRLEYAIAFICVTGLLGALAILFFGSLAESKILSYEDSLYSLVMVWSVASALTMYEDFKNKNWVNKVA